MSFWRQVSRGLRGLLHGKEQDREIGDEVRHYFEEATEAYRARGLSEEDARRAARLEFGNPHAAEEEVRSYGWENTVRTFSSDLRYGLRQLRRNPGFTAVAVLTLALGIGGNTAVFSVVDAVLLKPLTYPDPQALVQLVTASDRESIPVASIPEYNIWQQQSTIFQQVAAYDWGGAGMNLSSGDHPEQVRGGHVTSGYFALFGAPIVAGRTFTASEDSPNGDHVVVLSYGLWKSHFGGNPNVVGSSIRLDDQSWMVIGIIGRDFVTDSPIDLWIPFQFDLSSREMARHFNVAARLKPHVTLTQANAQLALTADQFSRTYGSNALPPHGGFRAVSLQESLIGTTRFPLIVLLGAVGFVFLIACANVGNLLLARASVRKRELAIRAALGARRGQVIRQLLTESLTLSAIGGLLGLAIGFGGVRLLLSISAGDIPRIGENGSAVELDYRILLFTFGISLLTGIVFGLAPAISASRPDLTTSLNENSRRSGMGLRHGKIGSLLVMSEVALALVLVTGAALLVRTFLKLEDVNPGFTTKNVLSASMSISASRFQRTESVARIVRDGRERLMSVPGVVDVGVSSCLPLHGCFGMGFDVPGRPKGGASFTGVGGLFSVSWSYFSTFEIPLLRGRTFTEQDASAAPGVIIINQAMAGQYWPNGDPLKDRIQIPGPGLDAGSRQIVGIVGDTRDAGVTRDPFPTMYIPIAQMPDPLTVLNFQVAPLWWIVRSRVSPYTLRAPIESALREATGGLPVAQMRTMDEVEARDTARQRFNMVLLTIFGISGLFMAAIGVYGVMSYFVQQRTQEMGVRMALGAQAADLRNMVIGQGMLLALFGLTVGLGGALWLTRFLTSFLFGVKAWDPVAFIVTPLLLGVVALLAVWIPARRATRVDPMTGLRLE